MFFNMYHRNSKSRVIEGCALMCIIETLNIGLQKDVH